MDVCPTDPRYECVESVGLRSTESSIHACTCADSATSQCSRSDILAVYSGSRSPLGYRTLPGQRSSHPATDEMAGMDIFCNYFDGYSTWLFGTYNAAFIQPEPFSINCVVLLGNIHYACSSPRRWQRHPTPPSVRHRHHHSPHADLFGADGDPCDCVLWQCDSCAAAFPRRHRAKLRSGYRNLYAGDCRAVRSFAATDPECD